MGDWPSGEFCGVSISGGGADTANSRGTSITAGTANVKGSWTALDVSTDTDSNGFLLQMNDIGSGGLSGLLDIGIKNGASGEREIIPNLLFGGHSSSTKGTGASVYFPIPIPAGSDLEARYQSSSGAITIYADLVLIRGGFMRGGMLGRVSTHGANTADSGGVEIDPGAAGDTLGAWTQVSASTITNPIKAMIVAFGNGAYSNRANYTHLFNIGVGSSSANVRVIIPNLMVGTPQSNDKNEPVYVGPIPMNVAAGAKLWAQQQSSGSSATYRKIDICIYGID